jgi:hypothetical protein
MGFTQQKMLELNAAFILPSSFCVDAVITMKLKSGNVPERQSRVNDYSPFLEDCASLFLMHGCNVDNHGLVCHKECLAAISKHTENLMASSLHQRNEIQLRYPEFEPLNL